MNRDWKLVEVARLLCKCDNADMGMGMQCDACVIHDIAHGVIAGLASDLAAAVMERDRAEQSLEQLRDRMTDKELVAMSYSVGRT